MKIKIKKLLAYSLLVTALAFPFGVDYYTSNQLQDIKIDLNKDGIDFDVLSTHGIIETQREIAFTVNDGSKAARKTINELKKSYPDYKDLFEVFDNSEQESWDKLLKGTKFIGYIYSNNYLLSKPKIEICLKELSNELMKEIRKNPKVARIILPLLSEEVLSANIILDFAGNIKNLQLKDIYESINLNRNANLKVELVGNNIDIVDENIVQSKTDKQLFKIKDRRSTFSVETNNIETYQNFKDTFEQQSKLSFEHFNLVGLTREKQEIISIEKASLNDEIVTQNNLISTASKYDINRFSFTTNNLNMFSVDSANLDIRFNDIEKNNLKELFQTYSKMIMPFGHKDEQLLQTQFIQQFISVLNNGFSFKAHSKFDKLYLLGQPFKNIEFDMNSKITKNSVDYNSNKNRVLKYLDLDAKLVLDKNSVIHLAKLSDKFDRFLKYGKDEQENKIFNISFKNSLLTINNKEIFTN